MQHDIYVEYTRARMQIPTRYIFLSLGFQEITYIFFKIAVGRFFFLKHSSFDRMPFVHTMRLDLSRSR